MQQIQLPHRPIDALDFRLFRVSLIHAVLDERPAVIAREALPVGEVLASIHLVLLTHVIQLLIPGFAEAVLHKVLAIISLETFIVGHAVTSLGLVLLR